MTLPGKKLRISVVDDEVLVASSFAMVLCDQGFDASFFTEPLQAIQAARYYAPDLLISEVSMPLLSGIELAIKVQKQCPKCKVLLLSGHPGYPPICLPPAGLMDTLLRFFRSRFTQQPY